MQWLNELPFADNRVLQIGFLAACGIAALIVLAIFYRLTFAHRLRVPGGRTRQPRLGLVDAFSLDGQRQLVLVRRDNVEHLVMIGGPNDVLVESQINRAVAPARDSNQVSPLLVPSAPARRTEAAPLAAPAAAEAPAKVAAKAPAAPAGPGCAAADRGGADPEGARSRPADCPGFRASGCAARSCTQTHPARTGAAGRRAAGGDASGGAHPTGAGESAAASARAASRAAARDDAPADHPRQRLAGPRRRRARDGKGARERPGQSAGPVSSRARAGASSGDAEVGSRSLESGAATGRNGENGGASRANSDRRRGKRRLSPGPTRAQDTARGPGVRWGAKAGRRSLAGRQGERRAERQAAQSRRSFRRSRFA